MDEKKQPVKSYIKQSNRATELVEECMLAANRAIAEHIRLISRQMKIKKLLPFIYRTHDYPNPTKLTEVICFLSQFSNDKKIIESDSKEINIFIKQFEGKAEKPIVHQLLLRTMAKAEYSCENIGHYGLGFKEYTHFTSPIRRYPDLIVHRLIKEFAKGIPSDLRIKFLNKSLVEISSHCTNRERIAMEAERACIKLTQAIMAKRFLGIKFLGTISGITNFGIFVLIDNVYAEGLVHIKELEDDYYYFDEKNFRLVGRRNKKIYHFGMRVKVKIINVNIDKRKLDCLIIN